MSDVVDAQLGGRAGVGNCLGLTVLYNVLAQEMGLRVTAVHLEDAFAAGPHVFTVLRTKERSVDIEHMFPSGFDFPGHRDSPGRDDWGDRELISDVYHSRGCDHAERHEWKDAADCYRKALQLNPSLRRIHNNLGFAYGRLKKLESAARHFKLAGTPAQANNNMGFVFETAGKLDKAFDYYAVALEQNPNLIQARKNLERVAGVLGRAVPENAVVYETVDGGVVDASAPES